MQKNVARLISLLDRMQNLSMHRPRMDQIEPELSMAQMILLRFLVQNPGCHAQDVADGLGITAPSVSVAVRKLEEAGWVESRIDDDDRRAKKIFPTPKTELIQKQFEKFRTQSTTSFLKGLEETEQEQLISLLEKAIIVAETNNQ